LTQFASLRLSPTQQRTQFCSARQNVGNVELQKALFCGDWKLEQAKNNNGCVGARRAAAGRREQKKKGIARAKKKNEVFQKR
jgi:hypothetical protein